MNVKRIKTGGRVSLDPISPIVVATIRLTSAQRDKLAKLGGADWVRRMIDYAPIPTSKQ